MLLDSEPEPDDYHYRLGTAWSGGSMSGVMDFSDTPIKFEPPSPVGMGQCAQTTLEQFVSRDYFPDLTFNDGYGSDQADSSGNVSPSGSDNSKMQDFDHQQPLPDLTANLGLLDAQTEQDCVKRLCLVCSDVASGYHYGVSSCEACKAFFKRTIQGSIEYVCPASRECEITKRRRKACQACRFQKCLKVGMLREGVRLDRVRGGRQKYKRVENGTTLIQPLVSSMPKKPGNETDNKYLSTLLALESQLDRVYQSKDFIDTEDSLVKFRATLSSVGDQELVIIISWAKQVPGFANLDISLQMNMLQSFWLDVMCLNLVNRSCPFTGHISFAENLQVPEEMVEWYGIPSALDHHLRRACQRFTELKVSHEEYVLLKAIILCNFDALSHEPMHAAVRNLQDKLQDSLMDCIRLQHPGNPRRLGQLFLMLPTITHIRVLYKQFWDVIKKDNRITMHKLFLEMLDTCS